MQQLRRSCAVRLLGCCDHYEASDHNTPSCAFLTSDGATELTDIHLFEPASGGGAFSVFVQFTWLDN
jgi:hypothetical protein